MKHFLLRLIFTCLIFLSPCFGQWLPASISLETNWGSTTSIDASDSLTIAISSSLGVYRSTDGGVSWEDIFTSQVDSGYSPMDISITDSSHLWLACSDGSILATADGGAHWIVQILDSTFSSFMNYIEFFDSNSGVAMGDGFNDIATILQTTDGGTHWSSVNSQAFGALSGDLWRRIDFIGNNNGYFFESGISPQTLNKTTNGGLTWTPTTSQPPYIQVLKFYNQNIGLAIADEGSIFRTLDGSVSWQEYPTSHSGWGNDIEFAPSDPAHVWMTDADQVYFSNDTGRTWTSQLNTGGRDIVFPAAHRGWLIGDSGKLYYTLNDGITSIENKFSRQVEYFLYQNYPNPFNPSTKIRFSTPELQFVNLKIFDLLGREITTLINEEKSPGNYEVTFDADNLANGIYFYNLSAGTYRETKKMILIK
jgi:photosystem II stability/assembly factor-like uncharacterized protein